MVNFCFGDFVTCLNNAKIQKMKYIYVKNTKLIQNVIFVLYDLGILRDFKIIDNKKIEISLKFIKRRCIFKKINLISKPSKRVYITLYQLIKLKDSSNTSIYILSTQKGIKIDFECIFNKLCGEVLIKIDL